LMGWVILDEGLQDRLDGREYRAYKTLIACRKVDQEFSERSVHPLVREAARLRVVELTHKLLLQKKWKSEKVKKWKSEKVAKNKKVAKVKKLQKILRGLPPRKIV
jgi:hypothetical protein